MNFLMLFFVMKVFSMILRAISAIISKMDQGEYRKDQPPGSVE